MKKLLPQKVRMLHIAALGLSFNRKTQVFPAKNGVSFPGWNYSVTESGRIVRRVSNTAKKRFYKAIQKINNEYNCGRMNRAEAESILQSYCTYLDGGDARMVKGKALSNLVLFADE